MSEKTIVLRRARLAFVKIRRGLIDAKHREAIGSAIWLYLFFHDIADRKQGIAAADLPQAAQQLGLSLRSVRTMYATLIEGGYLEPLRLDFEPASAEDRVAHRAPFVRISRYAEGAPRPGRKRQGPGRDLPGEPGTDLPGSPNRIAGASERSIRSVRGARADARTSQPAAEERNGKGPEPTTPSPIGQPNGQPEPVADSATALDEFRAWDALTDAFAHPFDRMPQGIPDKIAAALRASTDREPFEAAVRKTQAAIAEDPKRARFALHDAIQLWTLLARKHAARTAERASAPLSPERAAFLERWAAAGEEDDTAPDRGANGTPQHPGGITR